MLVLGVAVSLSQSIRNAWAEEDVFAIQSRLSTPNFQLFIDFGEQATVTNPNSPLFTVEGGVYGMTFLEDTLYGVELENGSFVDYLFTVPHEGNAIGTRVGSDPIGFPAVEALATIDGLLYGSSVDFEAHRSTLIVIDPGTGVGTAVGEGTFDVIVVGLAYDRRHGVLYGAAIPFAGLDGNNLVRIDPNTGATTIIGDMQAPIQSLAWTPNGLFGAFDRLYQIDTGTGTATPVGEEEFTDGKGVGAGLFNGIYSLAAFPVELPDEPAVASPFMITSIERTAAERLTLRWESDPSSRYDIHGSASLMQDDWQVLAADIDGEGDETSLTIDKPGDSQWFLRVAKQ